MANNNKNNGINPTSHEAIHGKKVKIGKGTGERVGKQSTSARKLRDELRKKFLMET
jgi:hypothetical protein